MKRTPKLLSVLLANVAADEIVFSPKGGCYIARRTFFFSHGKNAKHFEQAVAADLATSREGMTAMIGRHKIAILSSGEVDKPFRGGAAIKDSRHWWVKFTVESAA
jgi:hypothetical protein